MVDAQEPIDRAPDGPEPAKRAKKATKAKKAKKSEKARKATKKAAPKAAAKRSSAGAAPEKRDPTDEEIRRRAYELWEERGREPGLPLQDWLRAERELRGRG